MRILAIESSAKAASYTYIYSALLFRSFFQSSALTHSRTLLCMAQDLLSNLELKLSGIDSIAVAKGPGSFTGIRIGLAAAKGLAWGADKPICGVSTLEAMAWHLQDRTNVIVCPAMDARRNEIYNSKFTFSTSGENM